MIRQIIRLLISSVTSVLQFILSARFINSALLIFIFLVSIGAAEEKHVILLLNTVITVDEEWKAKFKVKTTFCIYL